MKIEKVMGALKKNYEIGWLVLVIAFSAVLYEKIKFLAPFFDKIMGAAAFLTWHTVFEFVSILISFSIFIIPYYAYKKNPRLRGIILATIFLAMGILDFFHTLSYKGMPLFLIENNAANRATTLWIIARLIGAVGIAAASFISINKISRLNRKIFLSISILISLVTITIVTYYPGMIPVMYVEGQGITPLKKALEIVVILLLSFAGIIYLVQYWKKRERSNLLFAIAIIASIFSELAFASYYSVYDIYNYLGHVYKFISYFIVFKIAFVNNIEKPYLALYKAKDRLKAYAGNLHNLVEKRTEELRTINEKLLQDLEYAKDIQKAILPDKLPGNEWVSFDARYLPAERVSGDFYNIFRLNEQWIGMYIGDVSGHGVPAAMLTVFLNQSIKTTKELEENRFEVLYPSKVLNNLYEQYNKVHFRDEVYILVLYAIYNVQTKELFYSSAGMNVQPLILKGNGNISEIDIKGLPICNLIDIFPASYIDHSIQLESGDKVLFYTDGLVELKNEKTNVCFSEDDLKRTFTQSGKDPAEFLNKIEEHIHVFSSHKAIRDDITFFMMSVH